MSHRILLAELRLKILSLEIETGGFTLIYNKTVMKNRKRHPSERLCKVCNTRACEDEVYFYTYTFNKLL